MNRTTKTLLIAGGIIVLSYPGIAWLTGVAIESRIQHSEQHGLEQAPYLTLLKREYHRGVYRSTEIATYGLRMPQAWKATAGGALPPSITFTVASNIQHGPFPGLHAPVLATVDSAISGPPALQQMLSGVLGSKPFLSIHSSIGLLGRSTGSVTSPAFNLRLPDGSSIAWGGLTGAGTVTGNQVHWSGQLSMPRLSVQSPQGGFELAGIEYSGSHDKAFGGLFLGTGTFTIEKIDGSSPRSGEFSLQRISLASTSKADGDFFNIRIDMAMDAAKIATVQLTKVMYSESFEHVHGPSLVAMGQAVRTAEYQTGTNPAQLRASMQDAMRQYGTALLLHDPVIDISKVGFTMPEGSFLLSARISAPGLSQADLQWPAGIVALKNHALITADLRVDNGLVQKLVAMGGSNPKVTAQLTALEQQGYLTAGSSAVTTHVDFSGGRLSLNGHPFPPGPAAN